MFPRTLVLASLLLLPLATGSEPDLDRPTAALLAPSDGTKFVMSWTPGAAGLADEYLIYGLTSGGKTLLARSTNLTAEVDVGYPAYGVAAVRNDVESGITPALAVKGPCVGIHSLDPPRVTVGCLGKIHLGPHFALRSPLSVLP